MKSVMPILKDKAKYTKVLIVLPLLLLGLSGALQAQDYQTAVGLRAGLGSGLSVKHFLNRYNAVEGMVESRWDGINVTGLYEWQQGKLGEYGVSWYYGAGAHFGAWNGGSPQPWFDENDRQVHHVFGVDGIIGMEYTFEDFPLNLSLDWKPAFNLTGHTGLWLDNIAVNVRYAIR